MGNNLGWFIFGDFNELMDNDEKLGGRDRPRHQMDIF